MTDEQLVAVHEAGHSVVGARLGIPIARVALAVPGALNANGYCAVGAPLSLAEADHACRNRPGTLTLAELPTHLFTFAVYLLAGRAAERRAGGGRDGGQDDWLTLERLFVEAYAIPPVCDRIVDLVARFQVMADQAVEREWPAITRVADALLARRSLDASELAATMNNGG